jgi:glycogen operon protein
MRKEHVILHRKKFFQGRKIFGAFKDLMWLQPDGSEMTESAWKEAKTHTIGMMLLGNAMDEFNEHGERIADDTLLVLLNASADAVHFAIPKLGERWEPLISSQKLKGDETVIESSKGFILEGHSAILLRRML